LSWIFSGRNRQLHRVQTAESEDAVGRWAGAHSAQIDCTVRLIETASGSACEERARARPPTRSLAAPRSNFPVEVFGGAASSGRRWRCGGHVHDLLGAFSLVTPPPPPPRPRPTRTNVARRYKRPGRLRRRRLMPPSVQVTFRG